MDTRRARIGCLDLDTFFVSVERLLDPSLVGKPVVVGGRRGERGVVTSASYEVRALGVRSGMSMTEAVRLAPGAIFLPTRHDTYGPYAARVREVIERWCPEVQTASIDEFFLDFGGTERMYHRAGDLDEDATIERVVRELRADVQREVGLPASVGVGTTRPIAKMASGRAKPAGVLVVRAGAEAAFVETLPVRRFPGIGPVAERRLVEAGIGTLGELLASDRPDVRELAERVRRAVHGSDTLGRDRPAFREHDPGGLAGGSISNERTFHADVGDRAVLEAQLLALAERVCWRARRRGVRARTVTLKVRYANFETFTRSKTIPATDAEARVLETLLALFDRAWARRRVRLLGVALSNLIGHGGQLPLPMNGESPARGEAVDAIRARFGYDAIRLGATPAKRRAEAQS